MMRGKGSSAAEDTSDGMRIGVSLAILALDHMLWYSSAEGETWGMH
jgi:hypothetical protein